MDKFYTSGSTPTEKLINGEETFLILDRAAGVSYFIFVVTTVTVSFCYFSLTITKKNISYSNTVYAWYITV